MLDQPTVAEHPARGLSAEACTTRLAKYHSETAPIVPFYMQKGVLRRVDGVGDPDTITQRLIAVLES